MFMTTEDIFLAKGQLEKELESEPVIMPGDTVVVPKFGIKAVIEKVYYAFRCVEWHNERGEFIKHYDVEFIDTNGNYRHWKSYFDGGHIIYKERS